MYLDQMWLQTMGYMHVPQNAYRPEERAKLNKIGREPFTIVEGQAGMGSGEWRGVEQRGAQVFSSSLPIFDEIQDREGGLHDASRGQPQFAGQSGRMARALQAADQMLAVLPKEHIQSALERLNVMRLHNIQQFTTTSKLASVVSEKGGNDRGGLHRTGLQGDHGQVRPEAGRGRHVGPADPAGPRRSAGHLPGPDGGHGRGQAVHEGPDRPRHLAPCQQAGAAGPGPRDRPDRRHPGHGVAVHGTGGGRTPTCCWRPSTGPTRRRPCTTR